MTVQIADVNALQFGDLGDAITDELDKRLGYMKDRQAKYLAEFVRLLDSSGLAEQLATRGSDSTKALVGRARDRFRQLADYSGSPPEWLFKQTKQDVVDVVKAAQNMGLDTKDYVDATIGVIQASVPKSSSSASPVATIKASGQPEVSSKAGAPILVSQAKADVPMYAPHATDLMLPASERPSAVWKTVKEYALPIGIVGAGVVAAVVVALLEKKPRRAAAAPGMAGAFYRAMPGTKQRSCPKLKKRWLAAEGRAHRAKGRAHQRAERQSTSIFNRAQHAGCPWAL